MIGSSNDSSDKPVQLHSINLYLGRMVDGRHLVTEESFMDWLGRAVVSKIPAFAVQDLTYVWQGQAEPTTVLTFISGITPHTQQVVAEIAKSYKDRFEQNSVLVVISPVAAFEFESTDEPKETKVNESKSLLVL